MLCPCCSKLDYDVCCRPFLEEVRYPPSPETLMRSRFTAFFLKRMDYILQTMRGKALAKVDRIALKQDLEKTDWAALEVLNVKQGKQVATVEFIAYYQTDHLRGQLHEESLFHKIDGLWFYVDEVIRR